LTARHNCTAGPGKPAHCSEALAQRLEDTFPNLFRKYKAELRFRDGWYQIVEEACAKVSELYKDKPAEAWPHCDQIKEKFGELRLGFFLLTDQGFYMPVDFWIICEEAMNKSKVTCENCGQPGVTRRLPRMRVLCDEHSEGGDPVKPFFELQNEMTEQLLRELDNRE
jgi:hypothetical protein